MGRITISNSSNFIKKDKDFNLRAGFNSYNQISFGNIKVVVYHKRLFENENFLKIDKFNFIATVGTIIYKGFYGIKALKLLFDDFENNINFIRKHSLGNYNICIRKYNKIYFFTDKYNIINSYYFNDGKHWFLTNCLKNTGTNKLKHR